MSNLCLGIERLLECQHVNISDKRPNVTLKQQQKRGLKES